MKERVEKRLADYKEQLEYWKVNNAACMHIEEEEALFKDLWEENQQLQSGIFGFKGIITNLEENQRIAIDALEFGIPILKDMYSMELAEPEIMQKFEQALSTIRGE